MSHFYGTIQGNRGETTRGGSKDSGLTTFAASWKGAVRVDVFVNQDTGEDVARVALVPWRGRGINRILYEGPVGELRPLSVT